MKVSTKQHFGFSDALVEIPASDLDIIDELIDWQAIEALLYSKLKGFEYSLLSLFKMQLLQTWNNLSDESIAQAVTRDLVYIKFCQFSIEGNKPSDSTLLRFRTSLVKYDLMDELLDLINANFHTKGLKVRQGSYVTSDATLISSARRPRKQYVAEQDEGAYEVQEVVEYSDDTDASWKNKGKQSVYGYSANALTDAQGLVNSVCTHTAKTSEQKVFSEVIDKANLPEGTRVLYDKGVVSKANQEYLKTQGLKDGIMRKKPKGRRMSGWSKLRNRLIGQKRFVTERTFGTIKRVYGLHRSRYLGIEKVHAEFVLKSLAYNIRRCCNLFKSLLQGSCVQNQEMLNK